MEYDNAALGTPLLNVAVRLLESSRIEIRSPALGDGYFPVPDPEQLDGDRFVPFDLVEFTDKGMLLTGSIADVINIAGRKLNPLEVELLLKQIPGVEEAVVFGIPSLLRNEEAIACIVGSIPQTDLLQQAQALLGVWQIPRDFWRVESLPSDDRRVLAERYLER